MDFVDPDGLEDPVEEVDEELDVADELETLSSEPDAKEKKIKYSEDLLSR